MPLTEITIRQAKPTERPRKLFDGGGLYLLITPQGCKYWRYRYRFAGKDRTLGLGIYGEVSLKQARQLHRETKSLLYHRASTNGTTTGTAAGLRRTSDFCAHRPRVVRIPAPGMEERQTRATGHSHPWQYAFPRIAATRYKSSAAKTSESSGNCKTGMPIAPCALRTSNSARLSRSARKRFRFFMLAVMFTASYSIPRAVSAATNGAVSGQRSLKKSTGWFIEYSPCENG